VKNSIRTSQEIHSISISKTNRLMLFREIIATYCENHMEHIITLCGQNVEFLNVTADGTCTYQCYVAGCLTDLSPAV
jgi:hypothetical protein